LRWELPRELLWAIIAGLAITVAVLWPSKYPYSQAPQVHSEQQAKDGVSRQESSGHSPAPQVDAGSDQQNKHRTEHATETTVLGIKPGEWLIGIVTWMLWFATVRLVRGAEETARRQLRAYVGVTVPDSRLTHPDPSLQSSDPSIFKMALEIKNSGQTPAYDMITRYTTMLLDHPVAADYDFSRPIGTNPSRVVLNPNACIRSQSEPHPLSASEIEEIKDPDSKRRLYSFGEIKYRDAFNTGRHTHFCFYNEWDGETFIGQVSEHYNDAD
jgi:hypothetical protein